MPITFARSPTDPSYITVRNAIKSLITSSWPGQLEKGTPPVDDSDLKAVEGLFEGATDREPDYHNFRRMFAPGTSHYMVQLSSRHWKVDNFELRD